MTPDQSTQRQLALRRINRVSGDWTARGVPAPQFVIANPDRDGLLVGGTRRSGYTVTVPSAIWEDIPDPKKVVPTDANRTPIVVAGLLTWYGRHPHLPVAARYFPPAAAEDDHVLAATMTVTGCIAARTLSDAPAYRRAWVASIVPHLLRTLGRVLHAPPALSVALLTALTQSRVITNSDWEDWALNKLGLDGLLDARALGYEAATVSANDHAWVRDLIIETARRSRPVPPSAGAERPNGAQSSGASGPEHPITSDDDRSSDTDTPGTTQSASSPAHSPSEAGDAPTSPPESGDEGPSTSGNGMSLSPDATPGSASNAPNSESQNGPENSPRAPSQQDPNSSPSSSAVTPSEQAAASGPQQTAPSAEPAGQPGSPQSSLHQEEHQKTPTASKDGMSPQPETAEQAHSGEPSPTPDESTADNPSTSTDSTSRPGPEAEPEKGDDDVPAGVLAAAHAATNSPNRNAVRIPTPRPSKAQLERLAARRTRDRDREKGTKLRDKVFPPGTPSPVRDGEKTPSPTTRGATRKSKTTITWRSPAPEERRAARKIATALRKAKVRAPAITDYWTAEPPGRVDMRMAMQEEAFHAMGMDIEVPVFQTTRIDPAPEPELAVGFCVDISGSMRWATTVAPSIAWCILKAVNDIGGRTCAVRFGDGVHPLFSPGRVPNLIPEFEVCGGGGHSYTEALHVLDEALHLQGSPNDEVAKLIFVFSDGYFGPKQERDGYALAERLHRRAGVKFVWVAVPPATPRAPAEMLTLGRAQMSGNINQGIAYADLYSGLPKTLTEAVVNALSQHRTRRPRSPVS